MKKWLFIFAFLLCLISLCSCDMTLFDSFEIDNKEEYFEITADRELIKYTGFGHVVEIPQDVLVIKAHAFDDIDDLYGVILPKDLQRIEDDAFRNCKKLVEVYNYSKLDIV